MVKVGYKEKVGPPVGVTGSSYETGEFLYKKRTRTEERPEKDEAGVTQNWWRKSGG